MIRYPLGIQTFSEIITNDYLYVDKTAIVYKLTSSLKYAFLSRPRRFGKSLLVSTLAAYFEGRKELFEGLAIEQLEKEWIKYPVIRFDFSIEKFYDAETLRQNISYQLSKYETIYGRDTNATTITTRFQSLVERVHEQTGNQAVVLIDEYDAPLLSVINEPEQVKEHRKVMQSFFAPLKNLDPHLKFLFITGITKFAQLSLFSELNNLKNISMLSEYASICGITEEEMLTQMTEGIAELAKKEECSYDQAVALLKNNYDGYHFTYPSPDIYNPYSLLNALSDKKVSNYWFSSGGTRLAIYALQKNNISPEQLLLNFEASEDQFDKPFERTDDFIPLLYQSGYLTIKSCRTGIYSLSVPNKEVRMGLFKSLLPNYIDRKKYGITNPVIDMIQGLEDDNLDLVFNTMKKVFASIPECNNTNYEGHYQSMLCVVFSIIGQYVEAEVHTANGRVDIVINNQKKVYLLEIKLNKSAEIALEQIEKKDYAQKFTLLNLPIVKVGMNFNSETENIEDWKVSEI